VSEQEDKELRIVWVFCIAICIVSAFITFWSIMTMEEKPRPQPRPAKLDRVYVSQKTCCCGHFEGVHEEVHGECLSPSCECLEFSVRTPR
jgi:hypothetical protein